MLASSIGLSGSERNYSSHTKRLKVQPILVIEKTLLPPMLAANLRDQMLELYYSRHSKFRIPRVAIIGQHHKPSKLKTDDDYEYDDVDEIKTDPTTNWVSECWNMWDDYFFLCLINGRASGSETERQIARNFRACEAKLSIRREANDTPFAANLHHDQLPKRNFVFLSRECIRRIRLRKCDSLCGREKCGCWKVNLSSGCHSSEFEKQQSTFEWWIHRNRNSFESISQSHALGIVR